MRKNSRKKLYSDIKEKGNPWFVKVFVSYVFIVIIGTLIAIAYAVLT